jgi:IS30 family transposase
MDFEVRDDRRPQGPRKLAGERAAYFELMRQGMSNTEACRVVGINRRTGKRWRYGRNPSGRQKAAPPSKVVERPSGPYRYLREADRVHIADRLLEKATIRSIAAELGRSPSTISREIRRNRHPGNGQYRPHAAQARADARRPRPKQGKIGRSSELRDFIQDRLTLRWSSEQICEVLRREFPHRSEMHVVHETIYQALYVQGRGELRRELTRALRTGRARRKPQRQAARRQPRFAHPMVMISERPAEAADRAIPGHREGDLIMGHGLLRQYFPKGTDLAVHSSEYLDAVAAQLNGRLRKTLGWETPAERLATLLTA